LIIVEKDKQNLEFWLDKWARLVVERERKLNRGINVFRTESGIGASGIPHIGSFADSVRQFGVTLALRDAGFKSEYIAYSDDRDGLRKVPLHLPNWLEEHLAKPVTDIPDPFECHGSYGEHMGSLLRSAIETAGIDYTFQSGTKNYKEGVLDNEIEAILLNAATVGKISEKMVGQKKFTTMLPYFPVCENCGRIYTTRAYELLPKEHKVLYACDQEFVGKNLNTGKKIVIKGCGHKGEASYFKGTGKLGWKCEFAARWHALKIVFEAHGKDILDSVKINDEVSKQVLGWEPPLHFVYEMFLEKGGKKISKSVGNVFSPQVWFNYATPTSLMVLLLKRAEGTREVDETDIPKYMDELDRLEDIYFDAVEIKDARDRFNAKRLFEFVHFLKPPAKSSTHMPYDVMIEIAKILPEKGQTEFAMEKLKNMGIVKKAGADVEPEVEKRLKFAKNFLSCMSPQLVVIEFKFSDNERAAIAQLIEAIKSEKDGKALQEKVFEIARGSNVKPVKFFQTVYQILLKSNRGPRLGPYILEYGKEEVVKKLKEAL
jgi:lysyl-tRNA synthetase class 1